MLIKRRAPRRASIRQQYVHMIRMLLNLFDQANDFVGFGEVGGDRDGFPGET